LFTASDFPVFEDPPVLCVSTSSEFDDRAKKKVVVFDPKVIQSQKRAVEPRPRNTCRVILALVATISRTFSLWKVRFHAKVGRQPPVHARPPVRVPPRPSPLSFGPAPGEPEQLSRGGAAERCLKDLAEKYSLISQIERQKDINGRLQVRIEQIQTETAMIRSRQPPQLLGTIHSHSPFGL
jgi:hypothetical protein